MLRDGPGELSRRYGVMPRSSGPLEVPYLGLRIPHNRGTMLVSPSNSVAGGSLLPGIPHTRSRLVGDDIKMRALEPLHEEGLVVRQRRRGRGHATVVRLLPVRIWTKPHVHLQAPSLVVSLLRCVPTVIYPNGYCRVPGVAVAIWPRRKTNASQTRRRYTL